MPTPFMHMRLVASLLPSTGSMPEKMNLLAAFPGAFLFGSTAPDVRNISTVSRRDTHFYPIPPDPDHPALRTMIATWPILAKVDLLPSEQLSFLAGYVAHLWFDEFWHNQIIYPYFVQKSSWGSDKERFKVYNILLGYLDRRDRAWLDGMVGSLLRKVAPKDWLPFVPDADLVAWRNYILRQLGPGAQTRTADILAGRARMHPTDFAALIADEAQVQRTALVRTPMEVIERTYELGLAGTASIISHYLNGNEMVDLDRTPRQR